MCRKLFVFMLISQSFFIISNGRGRGGSGYFDEQFQDLVDRMWARDIDRPMDFRINWGSHCDGYGNIAGNRLFSYVNERIFRSPQYASLISLFNADIFQSYNIHRIDLNAFKRNEHLMYDVFNAFTNTTVFNEALRYLQERGKLPSWEQCYNRLFYFWFTPYVRSRDVMSSSGFQHVYLGEWKRMTVNGLHNWVRYYHLEKSGAITYRCYIDHAEDISGTIRFSWEGREKHVGGFNIATSPAFDFSVFTVCALVHPGQKSCLFKLNGNSIVVTTHTLECSTGTCLATAFPTYVPRVTIGADFFFVILAVIAIVLWS